MYMSDATGKLIAGNIENIEVDTDSIVTALQDISSALEDISPVGKMTYLTDRKTSSQAVTAVVGEYTSLLQLSITPGIWLITGTVVFPSNGTGYRHILVSDTINSTSSLNTMIATQPAFSGTNNDLVVSGVYVCDSNKNIYLTARQNSDRDLNIYGVLNAVKIL